MKKPILRKGPSFKRKGWMSQNWRIKPAEPRDPKDGRMPDAEDFAPESHLSEQELKELL